MKILHIAYSLEESSAATRLSTVQSDRHEVYFLLGRISKCDFVRERQLNSPVSTLVGIALHIVEIALFKFLRIAKDEIFSFGIANRLQNFLLKKIIKAKGIDLIHLHWGGYGFFPLAAASNLSIPIVVTAHDYNLFTGGCHVPMGCKQFDEQCQACPLTDSKTARMYIRKIRVRNSNILKRIRPIITAPSQYTSDKIEQAYPFLKIRVVGNTVGRLYENRDNKINDERNWYLSNRPNTNSVPTIITVGANRSTRQNKGQDILQHVLAKLHEARIEFNYISIGRYEEYEGVNKRLHFDKVNQHELKKLYSLSDLCLITSRYETFSQVALESILCGTPVIAFDISGPKDIISINRTGFLASAFDEDGFFQLIKRNLNFKFENIEMILNAAEDVAEKFSTLAITNNFDQIYNLALEEFKRNQEPSGRAGSYVC